jgi:hypothetical protein
LQIYDKAVNYLHRMVPVVLVGHLAGCVPGDVCAEAAVPLVLKACKDPVSNVRLRYSTVCALSTDRDGLE